MLQSLTKTLYTFVSKVANLGISGNISFHEKKKTQLLNIVVATSILSNLFFSIHNFLHQRAVLGIINTCLLTGAVLILFINYKRRFLLSRLVMTFMASILFTASALLFRNGGEYYLIANLIIIIIYFTEKIFLISVTILNCLLFIGIKIALTGPVLYSTVSTGRIIFNISLALALMLLSLLYFKHEQLSYQSEVEQKNKELEELNQAKQKLFSIIAHDLRSPIGQLKNSLDLVSREYLSLEEFRKISSKLSTDVDHLHTTLDNLLRWSISQFQGIVAKPEKVLLSDIIEKKAILFLRQSIEAKKIHLQSDGAELAVWADPDHLMLVFRNLLSNALKYSYQDGTITIRSYPKAGRIIIEVADNGIGMNAHIKSSIFNPVTIVSSTGTSNEKGTGLGLKLCKEFIEKNHGLIWVESLEHKGTTFYISLPEAT